MPESKSRKDARKTTGEKADHKDRLDAEEIKRRAEARKALSEETVDTAPELQKRGGSKQAKLKMGNSRAWVPWVFIPVGILGMLWMVVFQLAGRDIPFMAQLGDWNVLIGLGLIVVCFSFMTLWK